MKQMTRRGFLQGVGSVPLLSAVLWHFDNGQEDPEPQEKKSMFTEPKLEHRDQKRYVAIKATVAMKEFPTVLPQLWKEVFAWLGAQGVEPAGPPLLRFLVIDMPARM